MKKGFALMSPEKKKQIAQMGGRAAHNQGVAHKWNKESASAAGKKGAEKRKENLLKAKAQAAL
jgi:general stress protein YciG